MTLCIMTLSIERYYAVTIYTERHHTEYHYANETAHIRHQLRERAVLSCHRFLIKSGVETLNKIKYSYVSK
jgi:hypothetical protein